MMNKENILIFNFEANKPPVFKEERGKGLYRIWYRSTCKEFIP